MTANDAKVFWTKLHEDILLHHAGPRRTYKWQSLKAAVRNKIQVMKTQTLQSPHGLAQAGVGVAKSPVTKGAAAAAKAVGITTVAVPLVAAVPVAVPIGLA